MTADLTLRDATETDFPSVQAIYAHHVLHGTATYEETPPDLGEMLRRWREVRERGFPWIVAAQGGTIAGYAYANYYRPRSAYRHTCEDSVYLAPEFHRRGVGTALLTAVIARCEAAGCRQMVAVIGDSANLGSIRLHAHLGFADAGVLRDVGLKFGRWLDSILMQRALGAGAGAPPPAGPAPSP